jgi:hypothetical protein
MPPTRAATPNVPQIKPVRLKRVDPVASKYQFRLGDGEVNLMKAFSLDGPDGIGSESKGSSAIRWNTDLLRESLVSCHSRLSIPHRHA